MRNSGEGYDARKSGHSTELASCGEQDASSLFLRIHATVGAGEVGFLTLYSRELYRYWNSEYIRKSSSEMPRMGIRLVPCADRSVLYEPIGWDHDETRKDPR